VLLFSYVSIFTIRFQDGNVEVIDELQPNVLIAMGFSTVTMAGAKGITMSYIGNGKLNKTNAETNGENGEPTSGSGPPVSGTSTPGTGPPVSCTGKPVSEKSKLKSLIGDDNGNPDLSKMQMIAWTLIAIVIYLILVIDEINSGRPRLPDIDASLMVLMGLGDGAYLGKKLITTAVPRLTGLSKGSELPEKKIKIFGNSFGEVQGGSMILIDAQPFQPNPPPSWGDNEIEFTIPSKHPNGTDWSGRVLISIMVGGQESANSMPFTVEKKEKEEEVDPDESV